MALTTQRQADAQQQNALAIVDGPYSNQANTNQQDLRQIETDLQPLSPNIGIQDGYLGQFSGTCAWRL